MNTKTQEANARLAREALAHIRKTRAPSTRGGRCYYSGLGCAFAPAVLPEHREAADSASGMQNSVTASTILKRFPGYLHEWAEDCHPDFADRVQRAHDANISAPEGDDFVQAFELHLQAACLIHNVELPNDL